MRLTSKAVKTACIAVTYKLIKLSRSVNITKSAEQTSLVQTCDPVKILTGIEDIPQLVFQLIRFIPHTSIEICKVSVVVIPDLKIHTRRLMKQHPACTAENLDIPFIVRRKSCKHFVTKILLSTYP